MTFDHPFRFYDNRQKYLAFVNTCSEKWQVAKRVALELGHLRPEPPALRVFDAGMGDGTVLSHTMRALHFQYPTLPLAKRSASRTFASASKNCRIDSSSIRPASSCSRISTMLKRPG